MGKNKKNKLSITLVLLLLVLFLTLSTIILSLINKLKTGIPATNIQNPITQISNPNSKTLCEEDEDFIDTIQSDALCKEQGFRCADGWSLKIYYDKRQVKTIPDNHSSLHVPEELDHAVLAKYSKSNCDCNKPISYQIVSKGESKEISCAGFYGFIEEYNSSCGNCILAWETGCC